VRLPVLIVAALLLAGCSGDDGGGPKVSASQGEDLVLSDADVGRPFTQFDQGEQRRTDMAPPRDDPSRFHRQGGWKARFQRGGTVKTKGPLVIESRADLFESRVMPGRTSTSTRRRSTSSRSVRQGRPWSGHRSSARRPTP
jgi:hypothetical protein